MLSVPAVLGAGLLSVLDILETGELALRLPIYITVFIASAVTGYICIAFLLAWLRRRSLYPFAVYAATFGLFYLLLAFLGAV